MSVASTVESTRATVSKAFQDGLYNQRGSDLYDYIKRRHNAQNTPNIDADSSPLYELVEPHVESFNWIWDENEGGLQLALRNLPEITLKRTEGLPDHFPNIKFSIKDVRVGKPTYGAAGEPLLPHQARELGITYDSTMIVTLQRQVGDGPVETCDINAGRIPIMVKTRKCHLDGLSRRQMVQKREEAGEWGGYFILNGNERLVRLLIMPRRNHIMGMIRSSFLSRGIEYTQYATSIRCVRRDQSACTVTCHYLETGSIKVRFAIAKQEFFIPAGILLKALTGISDREIYEKITLNDPENAFESERTEMMIRESKELHLTTRSEALQYLGRHFRLILRVDPDVSDARAGLILLERFLFVHIQDFEPGNHSEQSPQDQIQTDRALAHAKSDLLILMVRKLFKLVQDKIKPDNVDALSAHEVLLPGHLYNIFLKEQLNDLLIAIKGQLLSIARNQPDKFPVYEAAFWKDKIFARLPDIGRNLRYFIVTGNLRSRSGLDLMQVAGYTINAEKLNYWRYLSHFRAVHRGQFFTTMKTTAVRKLLPESWGFVCPVHTPDGSPCGLLNHLSRTCRLLTHNSHKSQKDLLSALFAIGMQSTINNSGRADDLPVILDGVYIGSIPRVETSKFVATIRHLKVSQHPAFDQYLEIFAVTDYADRLWPSVSLSTTTARFMRPVYYLPPVSGAEGAQDPVVEYIGALEQLNLEIAVLPQDYIPQLTTHQEIAPTNILSVLASLTPFSDHNQSPRNMYQCQMGKQTMSTAYHSHPYRIDNKVFRLQNPQTPIVRNEGPYQKYLLDEYPHGCNAVVAVISYTGYDMEDAMIINKSAYERGFGHGSVYKYKIVDLTDKKIRGESKIHHHFDNTIKKTVQPTLSATPSTTQPTNPKFISSLDKDGLPTIGQMVNPDDPLYTVYNDISHTFKAEKFKDTEPAYVEQIRALNNNPNTSYDFGSTGTSNSELQKVSFKLRMNRNPVIGDKFSSRHGQKGVLSILFPQIDMPWTESGISPDVIINPHAFPSRMTIGMLIESMAGKAGALHGEFQDGTPFQFDENNSAVDYFGQKLRAAGYNYLGSEPLYSGLSGEPLMADIFIGVVYYQRLRHMVKDKFQARANGPINSIHRQPIKGRKVHGGIRLGEMERDSLIAHGTSFLLQDRLMHCSDTHKTFICRGCGSLIAPQRKTRQQQRLDDQRSQDQQLKNQQVRATGVTVSVVEESIKDTSNNVYCRLCDTGNNVCVVNIPYIFMYLVNELAAMNIRLTFDIK